MRRTFAIPLLTACALLACWHGLYQAEATPTSEQPSVFDLPKILAEQAATHRQVAALRAQQDYKKAEALLKAALKRIPHDQAAEYNLGCVLARQMKVEEAFAHLTRAVELGWRGPEQLKKEADLESLRGDERFDPLLEAASAPPLKENSEWKYSVTSAEPTDGTVIVSEDATAYDGSTGLLLTFFRPSATDSDAPIVKGFGEAGKLLAEWSEAGTAAGNYGDFYDNHDNDHSNMNFGAFPQLTRIEFSEAAKKRNLHQGLQDRFVYNQVTIGNSSTAIVSSSNWRSQGRFALTKPRGPQLLALHYLKNHLYFYPEHRDHDPGHNGQEGGGYGDVFPANTPYLIISQGSSGSDREFMNAVAATLAAFRPDVKMELKKSGLLMPAVQMIFRMSNKQVETAEDYLTGKAHPTVFDGKQLDAVKMVKRAHDIQPDSLPPLCLIEVVEEEVAQVGRDYFDIGPREKLFDTPCAVARVVKSTKYERRMVLSAEKSRDVHNKPLTYHWKVLRGDKERIQIRPINDTGSKVELIVPYHSRRPISEENRLESNRVDIGAFVKNGASYSPPAFVSFYYLDNELRTYDEEGRIVSVDYQAESVRNNYVDPLLDAPKDWRDDYHYNAQGELTGWTRTRARTREEFTAEGRLILEPGQEGKPPKTAAVKYDLRRWPNGRFLLVQETAESAE